MYNNSKSIVTTVQEHGAKYFEN